MDGLLVIILYHKRKAQEWSQKFLGASQVFNQPYFVGDDFQVGINSKVQNVGRNKGIDGMGI